MKAGNLRRGFERKSIALLEQHDCRSWISWVQDHERRSKAFLLGWVPQRPRPERLAKSTTPARAIASSIPADRIIQQKSQILTSSSDITIKPAKATKSRRRTMKHQTGIDHLSNPTTTSSDHEFKIEQTSIHSTTSLSSFLTIQKSGWASSKTFNWLHWQ